MWKQKNCIFKFLYADLLLGKKLKNLGKKKKLIINNSKIK